METLKLTKKDFVEKDGRLVYEKDLDFDGHIEIEGNLGWLIFKSLKATGYIIIKAGSGIKAGEGGTWF